MVTRFQRLQIGHHHRREGVPVRVKLRPLQTIIHELDDREFKAGAAAPQAGFEPIRPPEFLFIAQHRQADDVTMKPIEEPVIVHVHALGKARILLALHFDMNQDPRFDAIPPPDLNQFVNPAFPHRRIRRHAAQFLRQELVSSGPVNVAMRPREEKRHEVREVALQDFLPRIVVAGLTHRRFAHLLSCGNR